MDPTQAHNNHKTCKFCGEEYRYNINPTHEADCAKNPLNKKFKRNSKHKVLYQACIEYLCPGSSTERYILPGEFTEAAMLEEGLEWMREGFFLPPLPKQGVYHHTHIPGHRIHEITWHPLEDK